MDTAPLTWADVATRLKERGRGAPYQLAQRLSLNPSYFYRKLKGRGEPTERQAYLVRAFLENAPDGETSAPAQPVDRRRLDVYGFAAAGPDEVFALGEGQAIDQLELPMGIELGPGEYFVVRPPGSSMEPRIFPGEPLVVRRHYPPARDKDVIVEFSDGTGLVKTYKGQKDGRVLVEQFNPPKLLSFDATSVRALHAVAFKL